MIFLQKQGFVKKTRKDKYFTSDDALELGKAHLIDNNVLVIKNLSLKLWKLLDDIEKILYKESFQVITENKPIFDAQKLILIRLDAQIEIIYNCGLISPIKKKNKVNLDSKLDGIVFATETIFKDWNQLAIKANETINKIKQSRVEEKNVSNFMKTIIIRKNENSNLPTEKKYIIITIVTFLLIICIYFLHAHFEKV